MATGRGAIPKRSEERIRRNKPDVPVEKLSAFGSVVQPPMDFVDPHPKTVRLWNSLADSAQSKYYEPSDWEYARITLHFLDGLLWANKPSAQMAATVVSMMSNLLMTEGDRRRVRLEIERAGNDAEVFDIANYFRTRAEQAA